MAWLPPGLVQFAQQLAPGRKQTLGNCDKFVRGVHP